MSGKYSGNATADHSPDGIYAAKKSVSVLSLFQENLYRAYYFRFIHDTYTLIVSTCIML